ncbi:MAG: Holliday junction resolvase RuvX [Gemmatimonadetes bacterium]|nr:Holliday junction resolvase RuvX [Gemmatimonadota bacterium]MYB61367.1 Holliday junction resolvase RuvX [Gemmatimonadota bacterium]
MPRKNRPNSATTPRRQKSKRGRQTGLPTHGADGLAGDLADTVAPSGTGTGQPPVGRVLAVDYGERRVGLALSDPAGLIAQGLDTLQTADTVESLASIVVIVEEQQVREIILGLPVHMDGTAGEMAGKVEALADELRKKVSCDVRTWDERLTSVSARRTMHEMGSTARGNKGSLDRIAATLLLQNYLDFRRGKATEPDSRP